MRSVTPRKSGILSSGPTKSSEIPRRSRNFSSESWGRFERIVFLCFLRQTIRQLCRYRPALANNANDNNGCIDPLVNVTSLFGPHPDFWDRPKNPLGTTSHLKMTSHLSLTLRIRIYLDVPFIFHSPAPETCPGLIIPRSHDSRRNADGTLTFLRSGFSAFGRGEANSVVLREGPG